MHRKGRGVPEELLHIVCPGETHTFCNTNFQVFQVKRKREDT